MRGDMSPNSTSKGIIMMRLAALVFLLCIARSGSSATFTVDTTDDLPDVSVNAVCANANGKCSLRAAMTEANATPALDDIRFNIPGTDPGCDGLGVCRIAVSAPTPQDVLEATQPVAIDGSTQPGNNNVCTQSIPNRPVYRIVLQGIGENPGLRLATGADGSVIRGLNLRGFQHTVAIIGASSVRIECNFIGTTEFGTDSAPANPGNGILVGCSSSDVSIGGGTAERGNLISDHQVDGIQIIGDGCSPAQPGNVFVRGNFIGTDKTGTADLGNAFAGISMLGATTGDMSNIRVGDKPSAPDAGVRGNVISGNGTGIFVSDRTTGAVIVANLVGTAASGNALLGNTFSGIYIEDYQCDGNHVPNAAEIGSLTNPALGNVLSGNSTGVYFYCAGTAALGGNIIGAGLDRTTAVPNGEGVVLEYGQNVTIGTAASPNLIARNTREGVLIYGTGSNGIGIRANQIRNNGALGIDLGLDGIGSNGANPNDPGDIDTGPNGNLNVPVIVSRSFLPMSLMTIDVTIDTDFATPTPQTKRVDFYIADSGAEEGAVHLGSIDVSQNGAHVAQLSSVGVNQDTVFVATLTDLATNATSEFSQPFPLPIGIFANGFEN